MDLSHIYQENPGTFAIAMGKTDSQDEFRQV